MQTIAVMNQKGGCGKTTVCVHLAVGLAKEGSRVCVLDADRQGSATRWAKKAPTHNRIAPEVTSVRAEALAASIAAGESDHDFTLIDTAGDFKSDAQRQVIDLLPLVDLVIVPILPTPLDVDGANDLLQALRAYKEHNKTGPKIVLLINKAKRNALTRDAKQVLPRFGFPVLTVALNDRAAYASEVGFGGTAFDRRPSDKARLEIQSLLNEVKGYL